MTSDLSCTPELLVLNNILYAFFIRGSLCQKCEGRLFQNFLVVSRSSNYISTSLQSTRLSIVAHNIRQCIIDKLDLT